MATVEHTAPAEALPVPRYVRNLNALAERAGMSVTMRAAPFYDDDPEPRLVARWEGTLEQLAATGLMPPHTLRRLPRGGRRELSVPSDNTWNPLLMGVAHVEGDRVTWEIDFGSMLYSIEQRGDVEAIAYPHETIYHGNAEALEGAGIPRKHLPTGKHTGKTTPGMVKGPEPIWRARRQPDGTHVYCRESDEACRIRCEQEAQRQHRQEEISSARPQSTGPQNAADWKRAQSSSCANWVRSMIISLEEKAPLAGRFRLEESALQRIKAMTERFTRELLAELDQARVVDTQAQPPSLRLIWNGSRREVQP